MTELTSSQLWADIITAARVEVPPEHAMTRQQFAQATGVGITTAFDTLTRLVAEGKLRTAIYSGKRWWWPAE